MPAAAIAGDLRRPPRGKRRVVLVGDDARAGNVRLLAGDQVDHGLLVGIHAQERRVEGDHDVDLEAVGVRTGGLADGLEVGEVAAEGWPTRVKCTPSWASR